MDIAIRIYRLEVHYRSICPLRGICEDMDVMDHLGMVDCKRYVAPG